ncbi:MAG: hypothetical protein L0387_28805 [Acidobacteria bacterium]|nr:hypothetical protein [Acidobacteriota bacterium]
MPTVVGVVVAVGLSTIVSIVLTIALLPLWRWTEDRFGVESVGHSDPAE